MCNRLSVCLPLPVLVRLLLMYVWQATVPRLLEVSCSLVLHSSNAGELPRPVCPVITAPISQELAGLLRATETHLPGISAHPFLHRQAGGKVENSSHSRVGLWLLCEEEFEAHFAEMCMRQV